MKNDQRTRLSIVAVSGAMLATACSPSTGPSQSQPAQLDSIGHNCAYMIDMILSMQCTDTAKTNLAATEGRLTVASQIRQQADGIKRTCDRYPTMAPKLAELDACIADLGQRSDDETAAQNERLPKVRAKVPTIVADPRYQPLLKRWQDAQHAVVVAADNLEVAKAEQSSRVSSYGARLDRAVEERDAVGDEFRAFLKEYDVDPRDARAVGLW